MKVSPLILLDRNTFCAADQENYDVLCSRHPSKSPLFQISERIGMSIHSEPIINLLKYKPT